MSKDPALAAAARPFAGPADLRAILHFLMACRAEAPAADYEHVGDLLWGLREPQDLARNARLWHGSNGHLTAFALAWPRGGDFLWQVRPSDVGGEVDREAFRWARDRAAEVAREQGGTGQVWTQVRENNGPKVAFLERNGFRQGDHHYVVNARSLDAPLPEPAPPTGFALRAFAGEAEIAAYVAMHRDVWGPRSNYTAEAHRRLIANPVYSADLNPVAVAPDGTLAAYCICWLDGVNRLGLIEPLGTRGGYRRLGLGRAIVVEALRRLKTAGADGVLVLSAGENTPAQRLYESASFRPRGRVLTYWRDVR